MFELIYQIGVCLLLIVWPLLYVLKRFYKRDEKSVILVVLGDIGRSPRMKYHSLSLAKLGYRVSFIGYLGKIDLNCLSSNKNVFFVVLRIETYGRSSHKSEHKNLSAPKLSKTSTKFVINTFHHISFNYF
jgi:hypothetical protein